jgi:hypothetical protein
MRSPIYAHAIPSPSQSYASNIAQKSGAQFLRSYEKHLSFKATLCVLIRAYTCLCMIEAAQFNLSIAHAHIKGWLGIDCRSVDDTSILHAEA